MKKPKQFKFNTSTNAKKFSLEKSSAKKGYDRDWTAYRFRFLHHNPNCFACGVHKDITKIHVDHIYNARKWPDKFWDNKNHLPLCASCHSHVTVKFNDEPVAKLEWIKTMREKLNLTFGVKVVSVPEGKGINNNQGNLS